MSAHCVRGVKFYPQLVRSHAKKTIELMKKKEGYLRFLNIIMFCGVVSTYVHPLSINSPASFSSLAVAWW